MSKQGWAPRPRNEPKKRIPVHIFKYSEDSQRATRSLLVCALLCAQALPASRAAPVRPAGVANSSAATLRETLSDLTYCGDDNSQVRNGDRCRCPTGIIARGQLAVDPRVACRIRGWPR